MTPPFTPPFVTPPFLNVAETLIMSPAEVRQMMAQDVKEWAAVVKATGVKTR